MERSTSSSANNVISNPLAAGQQDQQDDENPTRYLEALTCSVERVDSLYHLASFMITHPHYIEAAGKLLKLQLPSWLRQRVDPLHAAVRPSEVIQNVSALVLHGMVALLFLQIVGLYSFITALATPQCKADVDCPDTTFCATGELGTVMTGYSSVCLACVGVMDWTGTRLPTDLVHHLNGNFSDPNDVAAIPSCQPSHYSNNTGDSFSTIIAMCLVAATISAYLAKEESRIMLTDFVIRRAGYSWWRWSYYEDDKKRDKSNALAGDGDAASLVFKVGFANKSRFELFQFLRRFTMQTQIAICTTMLLITASDARDFFLDATAVLFVVEVDNLIFMALTTSSEQHFYMETTKMVLDEGEVATMQFSKILTGVLLQIEIVYLAIHIKKDGINGTVKSIADIPVILAFVFVVTQVFISFLALFFSSYHRNKSRWDRRKTMHKALRAFCYSVVGGTTGFVVALHHIYGIGGCVVIFVLTQLAVSLTRKTKKAVEHHLRKENLNEAITVVKMQMNVVNAMKHGALKRMSTAVTSATAAATATATTGKSPDSKWSSGKARMSALSKPQKVPKTSASEALREGTAEVASLDELAAAAAAADDDDDDGEGGGGVGGSTSVTDRNNILLMALQRAQFDDTLSLAGSSVKRGAAAGMSSYMLEEGNVQQHRIGNDNL